MYLQTVISIKTIAKKSYFFLRRLKVTDEKKEQDPELGPDPLLRVDPDPYQNVTDPERCSEMNVHALGETSSPPESLSYYEIS